MVAEGLARMTNRSKAKGTNFESSITAYLQANGHPHAERRSLQGAGNDKGDIAGWPGVMIESKAALRWEIDAWMREVATQQANANAAIGVLWCKRKGKAGAADGVIVMTPAQFLALTKAAGW